MNYMLENRDILYNDTQLGPYPDHLLKRVEKPTNWIDGNIPQRKDRNESASDRLRHDDSLPQSIKDAVKRGKHEPLTLAMADIRKHFVKIPPNPVADEIAPIPTDPGVLSRHVKSLAYFLGADQVGICEVPEYAMFLYNKDGSEIPCNYKYAIVLVKQKERNTTRASDGHDWIFDPCSHQCYNLLSQWTETMANYIRRLGFEAFASYLGTYTTVMVPLLLAAGIGESGRLGLVVSPFLGPNFKSAAVLTNLPLLPDKPVDFGLKEYCKTCGICAQQCVSHAISQDNEIIEYNGYQKYKIDYHRCAVLNRMNQNGGNCGRCANICPWNRPESRPEYFRDWDGSLETLYESVNRRAAYLREHNFTDEEERSGKWWLDLYYRYI